MAAHIHLELTCPALIMIMFMYRRKTVILQIALRESAECFACVRSGAHEYISCFLFTAV